MNVVYDAAGWNALQESPRWGALLAVGIALVLAVTLAAAWRERRLAKRGGPWLVALRMVALTAIGVLLAGIERRSVVEEVSPSRVLLMTDRSASMALPHDGSAGLTRSSAVEASLKTVEESFATQHEVRRAEFDVTLAYKTRQNQGPSGSATHLGDALTRALADFASTPLAAIVVASDGGWNGGADPLDAARAAKLRGVPIHTLGVGPLSEPPLVTLRDLAAPTRASAADPFRVSVTIAGNAAASEQQSARSIALSLQTLAEGVAAETISGETLDFTLPEGGGPATAGVSLEGPAPGRYRLVAKLEGAASGESSGPALTAEIEFVDEPTRVLLAASGPSRDYSYLRDQLYRDPLFRCDVLLQSATGAVTQDAQRVVAGLPDAADGWEEYDVLVAIDLDWRSVEPAAQQALVEWVAQRGGGVAFVAGVVSTPSLVRQGIDSPLRSLLPVRLRDDPLGLGATGDAVSDPRPVQLSRAGEGLEWLALQDGESAGESLWSDVEGFYSETLPAEAKPGATVLAEYGEGSSAAPLLVEHLYGAGRVAYLATPELWRLRKVSPEALTRLQVGWLRRLCEGRQLGAESAGVLLFDRPRYDLGDAMAIRFVERSGAGGAAKVVRVSTGPEGVAEMTLAPVEGQPGAYAAALVADGEGKWAATLDTPSGRLTASADVALPTRESDTRTQNAALLREVATLSGGRYLDLSDPAAVDALRGLAAATPSVSETRSELGPPDEKFAQRIASGSLAVMAGALLLEWTLRRLWLLA